MERFDKLDNKLDKVTDDVIEVKMDVVEIKTLLKISNNKMEDHIAGDNKVIDQLVPILGQLSEMVQDHVYNKTNSKKRSEKLKSVAIKLGIAGTILSMLTGAARLTGLI